MEKKEKYTAAMIGCGMIAVEGHIPAFQDLAQRVSLKAVCGRDLQKTACVAGLYEIPYYYTDAAKMLQEVQPDLVVVCTPNQSHRKYIELALRAGCHVICEKPVTISYSEAKYLYHLAEQKGRLLVACQTQRFQPAWFAAREMVRQGRLGEIYYAQFSRIRHRGIPTHGAFCRKKDSGGGAMADIGVHMLDGVLWILGNPKVTRITASKNNLITQREGTSLCKETGSRVLKRMEHRDCVGGETEGLADGCLEQNEREGRAEKADSGLPLCRSDEMQKFDVEDFAAGVIETEKNISIHFKAAWAANIPDESSIMILGSKGGLTLPPLQIHSAAGTEDYPLSAGRFGLGRWDEVPFGGHRYLLLHVLNVLDGKEELKITPEQSLNVCRALDGFYRSAEQEGEIVLGGGL